MEEIEKILNKHLRVAEYTEIITGKYECARALMDEIITPLRLALIESEAKIRVYETALDNSNFKAIVVRKKNGEDNGAQ